MQNLTIRRVTRYTGLAIVAGVIAAALFVRSATPQAQTSCAALLSLSLPQTTITAATDVTEAYTTSTAGGSSAAITVTGPFPFCRVEALLTPTADSQIRAEIWMPTPERWNGKFVGVGNGGLSGSIWHTSMLRPFQSGYAVVGSNLGHDTSDPVFAVGHPEKVVDYAHRADHVTAQFGKAMVAAYHGSRPSRSYFHGCSNGGHQALMEAQRYPDDYDGIIAGAPWNHWTHQVIEFIWRSRALENLNPEKRALINSAVIAQCGGRDGGLASDGYLNAPLKCRFQPKSLLCTEGDGPGCLTAQEVQAVEALYQGPVHAETGRSLFPGFDRGSESTWTGLGTFVNNLFRNMVFQDPTSTWDYHSFDFNHDVASFDAAFAPLINSNSPNMSAFRARGGKLLMWHGWTDTTLEARSSLNYYNSVVATNGSDPILSDLLRLSDKTGIVTGAWRERLEETQEWFRLYMTPGVSHCGGGLGPSSSFAYTLARPAGPDHPDYDALAALDQWVEDGIAPQALISSHFTGGVIDSTRPLCVYPQQLRYIGGNPSVPESFACVDDWNGFIRDFSHELKNMIWAVRSGNLHYLPN